MGLTVKLEDENGEESGIVTDERNILHRLLPAYHDASFQYLRFIDWYGDTTFNVLQMTPFLMEWERIIPIAVTEEEKDLLFRIKYLAERCKEGTHLYLKFYGD